MRYPWCSPLLHLLLCTVKLIYYYPNDGGYDEEEPDIWKILEISGSTMVWEYYSKEPGLELYTKQTLRKVN